jgi:hypothetical protein
VRGSYTQFDGNRLIATVVNLVSVCSDSGLSVAVSGTETSDLSFQADTDCEDDEATRKGYLSMNSGETFVAVWIGILGAVLLGMAYLIISDKATVAYEELRTRV